ncbi:hypothetical protein [Winogradskyella sp. 3972H.M.0a.05]|uniref:hypothetical protein n=1 Tax=Winogradskyella sp. 3972H.M.0a.05 TaxID=2950277 RepID=UPI003399BEC4
MKKILIMLTACLFITACGEFEEVVFDSVNGQQGLGFNSVGPVSVTVPEAGISVTVPIRVTSVSSAARTFNVSVDEEASSGTSADYSVGTASIPADSYEGSLEVTFGNFENLEDFVTNVLVLRLDIPEGTAVIGFETTTINYVKEFVCPDLVLNIIFDTYPQETSWEITNSGGSVVASGDMYAGETTLTEDLCLPDGCYTFTIFDSFGDGICCGYGDGSYEITLDGNVLISGGTFGADESQNFCVE